MGLLEGPKTRHFNVKVQPRLFEAAARRIGTSSPAAVINAALASLATEDELGPWLARNWGVLAGELAGHAARAVAGGGGRIAAAFDRVELISDALTAILARLLPGLRVLFYNRPGKG